MWHEWVEDESVQDFHSKFGIKEIKALVGR